LHLRKRNERCQEQEQAKILVSKRTNLSKSYDTDLQAAGQTSPLSHLMRGQHPTTRNLFSVRCDGWMCQIGDSIDFHEREISLTSQAIANLLIIAQHFRLHLANGPQKPMPQHN